MIECPFLFDINITNIYFLLRELSIFEEDDNYYSIISFYFYVSSNEVRKLDVSRIKWLITDKKNRKLCHFSE